MMRTVGVGLAILGGAALIEAALIPGLVIGGAGRLTGPVGTIFSDSSSLQ